MNLYFFFSYNTSLKDWKSNGSLSRELNYYYKLKKKGFNIYFITYGDKSDFNIIEKKDFNVIPIFSKINKTKNKYINFIKTFFFLFHLKKYPLDNSIFKTNQMKGSWLAILAAKIYKKKILLRSGYEYYRFCKLSKINFFHTFICYLYSFFAYRLADKISITSQYEKNFICKNFKIKNDIIDVLPNFIDTELFTEFKYEKKYDIIYVGRLESQKNLFLLLEAIKFENLKFLLIGDGILKQKVLEFCQSNQISLTHLKNISNHELPKYYNSAKIFVTTTFYEGNPKTILESMSCKIPVISVKFDGCEDIFEDNVDSIIVDYDKEKLKRTIKAVLKDDSFIKKLGSNARKKILQNNDISRIVNMENKILYNEIS